MTDRARRSSDPAGADFRRRRQPGRERLDLLSLAAARIAGIVLIGYEAALSDDAFNVRISLAIVGFTLAVGAQLLSPTDAAAVIRAVRGRNGNGR